MKAELHRNLVEVRTLFFPSRSERWIRSMARKGEFGAAVKDGGGWLVPESGVAEYLARHRVTDAATPRPEQTKNLKQNR